VSNAAGAVSSAAETAVQEAPKTITVDLAEENESGQSGTATLTPNLTALSTSPLSSPKEATASTRSHPRRHLPRRRRCRSSFE
jgi:hypothetical protein